MMFVHLCSRPSLLYFCVQTKHGMNKICIIIALCLGLATSAGAQELYNSSGVHSTPLKKKVQPKGFDPQRLIFGGGLGLSFGEVTAVALTPTIGYRITDHFAAGVGLGFQYYNAKDFFQVYSYSVQDYVSFPLKSTFVYPSVWARYVVFRNIFVQAEAEYDIQHFKVYTQDSDPNSPTLGEPISSTLNYKSPALLLGAGLRQPISDRSSFVIMAMYDVIQDPYSPYLNHDNIPHIDFRFGFNVGF
jgi:hypothetical protein